MVLCLADETADWMAVPKGPSMAVCLAVPKVEMSAVCSDLLWADRMAESTEMMTAALTAANWVGLKAAY